MHVLFDQGIAGLALWILLVGSALMRLTVGKGRSHGLAPVLTASLAGFITVGLFDSLLDVPRDATLFYFMALLGLGLKAPRQRNATFGPAAAAVIGEAKSNPKEQAPRTGMTRWITRLFLLLLLVGLLAVGGAGLVVFPEGRSFGDLARLTPAESIRHAKSSLTEHDVLATALLPPLELLQSAIERPPPSGPLPTLGKGQQAQALPPQQYGATGEPVPLGTAAPAASIVPARLRVASATQLARAVEQAVAGQVIEIEPGRYRISHPVGTLGPGTAMQPITVRAGKPGDVWIEFDTLEGFKVTQPYWAFENLNIRGVCAKDHDCEHAFHVVGAARNVVLRNNRIEDFNAHIKVNGENGQWPDSGLVQFNTLTNLHPRTTDRSVAPFDLVAASGWQVADNLVSDFAGAGGNQVAYGMYMKGAGTFGRIERNVIICSSRDISAPGSRIGLSWGGGLTGGSYCRDGTCAAEHTGGLAANNVIAHCNDAGIDTNHGRQLTLAHNTLINTAGILVRGRSEDVNIYANLLEGRIRSRDGVSVTQNLNDVVVMTRVFQDPDKLRLDRKSPASPDTPLMPQVATDFCQQPRSSMTWKGATGNTPPPCVLR